MQIVSYFAHRVYLIIHISQMRQKVCLSLMGKFCTSSSPPPPPKAPEIPVELQPILWYYKSGKSTISISQHIVLPQNAVKKLFPNYYIHQDLCPDLEKVEPGFLEKSMSDREVAGAQLHSIFRLLVKGNIGNKDLGLEINSLKANPYMKRLVQLKESNKLLTKASQIIIDDIIEEKPDTDITQILKSNILEVEKLIETGLGLPVSFKISKFNVSSDSWLKSLAKKRKAIHSDVIECSVKGAEKKPNSLEEIVYNNGFRLEHLFLRPYLRGCPTDLLAANDAFNLEEVLKILSIVDFEGKIVLENVQSFSANVEFLDAALKKCGYKKRKLGEIDLIEQYMIF